MSKVDPVVDEAIETMNMKDGPTRRRLLGGAVLFSATAAASALISACTSSSTSSASSGGAVGNFPSTPKWQFWFVNHVTTNPFFTPTQYGMADAASLLGLPTPKWGGSQNSVISEMTNYFQQAVAAKADGIAVSAISHTAFTAPVKSAMQGGIPVITYNSDGEYVNGKPIIGTNRLAYVGQSLFVSGQSMGQQIKSLVPGGDIAIFIATPGTGNIQPRYDGAVSVLGSGYTVHSVPTGAETAQEPPAEKAYLLANKTKLKGAFAVDAGSTEVLGTTLKEVGLNIPSGGFDTVGTSVANIQNGSMNFTIYQDPYLQGFLPVLYLYLFKVSGGAVYPPDTDTGLSVVTKSNVSSYSTASRYQGSSTSSKYIPLPSGPINAPMATTST